MANLDHHSIVKVAQEIKYNFSCLKALYKREKTYKVKQNRQQESGKPIFFSDLFVETRIYASVRCFKSRQNEPCNLLHCNYLVYDS